MATTSSHSLGVPSHLMASLYVDNLPPDVTEAMLFDKLSSAGPIISIRISRDMITQQSLGYAHVNFQQLADAQRALATMNFDLLHGHSLHIKWFQREPCVGNLFIGDLNRNIDTQSLYDIFSTFGNILSCEIMTDENGESQGFGFVDFETQKAADYAINKVNGILLGDKKVYVGRFKSSTQGADFEELHEFTNVFIQYFGDQLNDEILRQLFSVHGKILSFQTAKDDSGHSKGFGFCTYENPEEAEKAVQALHGYSIGDARLYVGRFQEEDEHLSKIKYKNDLQTHELMNKYKDVNLYIQNLDDTIDDERLKKEFSKFGTVTNAQVMSENGRSKGFGFVCFTTLNEATKAVTEMNGSILGSKPLYVVLAQRKVDRVMHLTNQHMQRMVTSRVPLQMPLPFSDEMSGRMSYIQTSMCPSQPRNLFTPNTMPTDRSAQPHGLSAAPTNDMTPRTYAQMLSKHMPQSATAGVASRSGIQMSTRPRLIRAQTMSSYSVRSQAGAQSQPATTYTRTARNIPPKNADRFTGQEPLTLAILANATRNEQKQILGERLFPLIQQIQPELAGKITGMFLELDNTELLHMLESRESLETKIEEAIHILQAHRTKQAQVHEK
ncbi:unnamed protein product [Rotaria sp. Silwood2]|nr:unnamed protein product [Rotaria sp. Silwood2]CAF4432715.1 unnamed protein product [Rotaria sp. Silwood2]